MSTEDTTAQLREHVFIQRLDDWTDPWCMCCDAVERTDADIAAQVEAAKATARREELEQAADEWEGWTGEGVRRWLRARASAQGVAPPAEANDPLDDGCGVVKPLLYGSYTCSGPAGHGGKHAVAWGTPAQFEFTADHPSAHVQRSGGQGAQSSGHEYRPCIYCGFDINPGLARCPDHIASDQRDPGQPGEQGPADCACRGRLTTVNPDQRIKHGKGHCKSVPSAGDGPGEQDTRQMLAALANDAQDLGTYGSNP